MRGNLEQKVEIKSAVSGKQILFRDERLIALDSILYQELLEVLLSGGRRRSSKTG